MQAINRRGLLRGGAAALGAGAASAALSTTAQAQYYGKSYIEETVKPEHMNDVLRWTDQMLLAIRDHGVTPPQAGRILAIGHMAGFAAMNGIAGRYSDSLGVGRGPENADPMAAYHVAADIALTTAMQRSFRGFRSRMLAKVPNGDAKTRGIQWGKRVGKLIANRRGRDGSEDTKAPFYRDVMQKRNHVLAWEPTLPAYESGIGPRVDPYIRPLLPGWGLVDPLGVRDIKTYRADRFPDPRSQVFWNDVKLIASLGGTRSKPRTDDEAQIAFFWEDGPRGATPPGHFQIIAAQLFQGRMSIYDMARAMALVAMAGGDAGIAAWDSKYTFDIVRPETVIRRRARNIPGYSKSGFKVDSRWTSLILTPPFPAYTSGHSTFGSAGARMISHILGTDNVKFTLRPVDLAWWPDQLIGTTRSYTSVWDTAVENGLSRIWGGVHWTFDHDQAMNAGKGIANEIHARHFTPVAS